MRNIELLLEKHRVWLELLRTFTGFTVLAIQIVILLHLSI